MALIGHLRVANECRVALATLTAASSGPIPKAPGSAGGYLLPARNTLQHENGQKNEAEAIPAGIDIRDAATT